MTSFRDSWAKFCAAVNLLPRRVEGGGTIRWYRDGKLVREVSAQDYYGEGHVHPEGCTCSALIHRDHVDGVPA